MSGPAKRPTALTIVQGNPGKRALNKNEPQPPKGFKKAPDYFTAEAEKWYDDLCKDLEKYGVMSELDSMAAELLVNAYAEYRALTDDIANNGYTKEQLDSNLQKVTKLNPCVSARADAWKRVKSMMSEFGMTPSARTKINSLKKSTSDVINDLMSKKKA